MQAGDYILHDIGGKQIVLAEILGVTNDVSGVYRVIIRYANEPFFTKYTTTRRTKDFILTVNPNTPAPLIVNRDSIVTIADEFHLKKVEELA